MAGLKGPATENVVRKENVCCPRLSFITWNVDGILSKLDDSDFISYISSFDFICMVETFVDHFQSSLFPEHTDFCSPALKLSDHGRRSGGFVTLIKKKKKKRI